MTLEITVRGSAEKRYRAERAIVVLAAAVESHDKEQAYADAVALQEPLTGQLAELVDRGAITTWSSDQIRVFSHRPWGEDGRRLPLVHRATISARGEFTDFERLSGFLDYWAGKDGVEINALSWDVTVKNRRSYESDVRRAAVDDAVLKAQSYSDALHKGRVHPVQLADPGMLHHEPADPPSLMRASFDAHGSAPGLDLTPDDIVIRVAVDAKFLTD